MPLFEEPNDMEADETELGTETLADATLVTGERVTGGSAADDRPELALLAICGWLTWGPSEYGITYRGLVDNPPFPKNAFTWLLVR